MNSISPAKQRVISLDHKWLDEILKSENLNARLVVSTTIRLFASKIKYPDESLEEDEAVLERCIQPWLKEFGNKN